MLDLYENVFFYFSEKRLPSHFCGNSQECYDDQDYALQMAKINVQNEYLVVGYLENLSGFLKVLETQLSSWFTGSLQLFNEQKTKLNKEQRTTCKYQHPPTETTRKILQTALWRELELYEFIRREFDTKWAGYEPT